jgi:hypothetical protein
MSSPRNGKEREKASKQGSSSISSRDKAKPAPSVTGADTPDADSQHVDGPEGSVLDELLADEIAANGGASLGLRPGESPDQMLQRESMRTLQEPGLRPPDRLKVIQTLDNVNARLQRSAIEQDVTAELRGWIAEVMDCGPGPCSEQ